jgi:hypothetical protein
MQKPNQRIRLSMRLMENVFAIATSEILTVFEKLVNHFTISAIFSLTISGALPTGIVEGREISSMTSIL